MERKIVNKIVKRSPLMLTPPDPTPSAAEIAARAEEIGERYAFPIVVPNEASVEFDHGMTIRQYYMGRAVGLTYPEASVDHALELLARRELARERKGGAGT